MIHKHITSNITDGDAVDEIGEKNINSRKNMNVSPPPIFMDRNNSSHFNKSSPVKDLSFFVEGELRSNLKFK